jgi:predicted RNA-binding protein with PIN domain
MALEDPDDEAKLVLLLRSYRARTGKRISVVFDPGATYAVTEISRSGGIEVIFAPHGSSADALILRRVRKSRDPRRWLVITSDQSLMHKVAGWGARTMSADEFAEELMARPEVVDDWKDVSLSEQEVNHWLSLFEGWECQSDPD